MANINFMTIIDRLGSSTPGAEEEADKFMEELLKGQRGRKMRFSPFLLLEVPVKKLCSLDDIEKHNFNIGAPPERPKLEWSQTRRIRIRVTLKTIKIGKRSVKQFSGSAYLRVDSHGKRTFIDSEDKLLTYSHYYPDTAFNTEAKLKIRILGMLEAWHEEVLSNYSDWQDELSEWRRKRVRWELILVKQMNDTKIITLTNEEIADLKGTEEFMEEMFEAPTELLEDILTGESTRIAVGILMDNLLDSIALLRMQLEETEGQAPPRERLLASFDDEDDYEEPREAAVPTPKPYQVQQFHHWCLERHANWAKQGAFMKRTCHSRYQLGTVSDLTTTASKYWPQGNHGLILEKVRYDKDLHIYPWSLPASKLTATLKEAGREEIYFDVSVRKYLQGLELWYFEQSQYTKKTLLNFGLQE